MLEPDRSELAGVPVALHVQHLLGTGHLRRALALGRALAARGLRVLVLSGGMPVPDADSAGVRLVQLPPARAADPGYARLVDAGGRELDAAWHAARATALRAALREHRPRLVITETYPFGRRRLAAEMAVLFETLAVAGDDALVLCSIRDILEGFPGPPGRSDTVLEQLRRHYHGVLVHGDPALVDLAQSFPDAARIGVPVHYTGYVGEDPGASAVAARGAPVAADPGGAEVLVSTGGGALGAELVEAALGAHARSRLPTSRWRILVGHNLEGPAFARLRAAAPAGVLVERNRPDFRRLLAGCAVSVSQAGYNTVVDVLQCGARAVLVPFRSASQHEQRRRAALLAARGLVLALMPEDLDAATLADRVERAAALRVPPPTLRLDGAASTAALVERVLRHGAGALDGEGALEGGPSTDGRAGGAGAARDAGGAGAREERR